MNLIERCFALSSNLWLHINVNIGGRNKTLCVPKDGILNTGEFYKIYDFVEEKEFVFGNNDIVNSIKIRYVKINDDELIEDVEGIEKNNTFFREIFEMQKYYISMSDGRDENIEYIKSKISFNKIKECSKFMIKDFYLALNSPEVYLRLAKINCAKMLEDSKDKAISKLLEEKKEFEKNEDVESVEEIDLVIQIIEESIKDIDFESANTLDDLYSIWPPILLPTPF